jgi:hypothetical protein
MKEIFVMLAKAMSQEQVINRLQDSIAEYKEADLLGKNTEKELANLKMSCHLFILNGLEESSTKIINDMDTVNRRMKLFDTDSN